jgi:predicted Zn-dependent peptidase
MLSDIYYHSLFEDVEIQREKGAVCQEIHMYEDNPLMSIEDWFEQQLFPKHTLGRNIAGSVETVQALTRKDVVEWHDTFYSTDRTTVVLSGNLPKNITALVKKYFKESRKGKKAQFDKFAVTPKTYSAPVVALKEKKVDQAQLMLGFPGLPYGHKDEAAASLLRLILGGGMSSRLFIEVRERRGLAYLVRAGASQFQETGAMTVHAGLDVSKMKEAVQVICAEIDRMKKEPVTPKELQEAKDQWEGKITLASEDSTWQAEWYAESVFRKKLHSPAEVVAALRKVTAADIQRVAKQVFDWNKVRVAIIGPAMSTEALEKEIKNTIKN